jgi:hypothetical protein
MPSLLFAIRLRSSVRLPLFMALWLELDHPLGGRHGGD